MDRTGEQLKLAIAFLDEARTALDRVLQFDRTSPAWQHQHAEAMAYWARAYQYFRACHAAQKRVTLANAA
jgi:hypothetical protein